MPESRPNVFSFALGLALVLVIAGVLAVTVGPRVAPTASQCRGADCGYDMRDRSASPFQMMPGVPGYQGTPRSGAPAPGSGQPQGAGVAGIYLGVTAHADPGGVTVEQVEAGSPAERAGVQAGDLIVRADGKDTPSVAALRAILAGLKPGTQYDLVVRRGGKEQTLRVDAVATPATTAPRSPRQPVPTVTPGSPS